MEQQPNKIQPMLLSALAQLSACLIVWNFHIPNPNILLFVVLSAVLVKYGYAAGIVSGLIAFLYSAFFFSTDHSFFLYTSLNLQKLIVIGLGIAANILLIGRLQRQDERSNMEKMQAETEEKLQETTESYRAKLYHDVLTGAYNRRYYEDIASRIVGPAGIALMDVDDFKICNDTYGHYAGDMALETAANAIRSCIRNADQLIRYGGDEFLLVLPGIPSDIPASQTGADQSRRAAGYRTRLFAFSPLTEHRRNDAGHHRLDGERGLPGRPADVSGKGQQAFGRGGTPRKRADRAGRTGGGEAADPSCGRL